MPTDDQLRKKVELTNTALEHWHDFKQSRNPEDLKKVDVLLDEVDDLRQQPSPLSSLIFWALGINRDR